MHSIYKQRRGPSYGSDGLYHGAVSGVVCPAQLEPAEQNVCRRRLLGVYECGILLTPRDLYHETGTGAANDGGWALFTLI